MTSDEDLFEQVRVFLPKYLTPGQKNELWAELRKFPDGLNYYLPVGSFPGDVLQGDVWRGFVVVDFETHNSRPVTGLVLSNSCDIDPKNKRNLPVRALFCPLMEIDRVTQLLRDNGTPSEKVSDFLVSLKRQNITNAFYLPRAADRQTEYVAFLDDVHTHPLSHFMKSDHEKLLTLSQPGFYVLLLKLSIHFCRFQENLARFAI